MIQRRRIKEIPTNKGTCKTNTTIYVSDFVIFERDGKRSELKTLKLC